MHQGHLDVPEGILDALIMDLAVPAWGRCLAAANPHLRIAQLEEQLREACGQVAAGEHDAKAATALRLLPTYLARGGRL